MRTGKAILLVFAAIFAAAALRLYEQELARQAVLEKRLYDVNRDDEQRGEVDPGEDLEAYYDYCG